MDAKILFQLNEAYRQGVCGQIEEEVLSEEELLDIQEWVEALIEEGYDLDQYTDEDLYEAYLDEVRGGGRIDPVSGFPKHGEKASRTPKEAGLLMSPLDRAKARENALRKRGDTKRANQIQSRFIRPTERGLNRSIHASNVARSDEKKRLMSQNEEFDLYEYTDEDLYERIAHDGSFHRDPSEINLPPKPELPDHMKYGRNDRIPYTQRERTEANKTQEQKEKEMKQRQELAKTLLRQPQKEQVDIYDIILSHLLDEGYTETPEAAEVIMANMSKEWRDEIIEAL